MRRISRRNFLKITAGLGAAGSLLPFRGALARSPFAGLAAPRAAGPGRTPVVISTWKHGYPGNEAAWKILSSGGAALDAVEAGVRVSEGDPSVNGVGYGGLPDEECKVTLDASIMGPDYRAGAVAFIESYRHPISIARKVMETTDHVLIVGSGGGGVRAQARIRAGGASHRGRPRGVDQVEAETERRGRLVSRGSRSRHDRSRRPRRRG